MNKKIINSKNQKNIIYIKIIDPWQTGDTNIVNLLIFLLSLSYYCSPFYFHPQIQKAFIFSYLIKTFFFILIRFVFFPDWEKIILFCSSDPKFLFLFSLIFLSFFTFSPKKSIFNIVKFLANSLLASNVDQICYFSLFFFHRRIF